MRQRFYYRPQVSDLAGLANPATSFSTVLPAVRWSNLNGPVPDDYELSELSPYLDAGAPRTLSFTRGPLTWGFPAPPGESGSIYHPLPDVSGSFSGGTHIAYLQSVFAAQFVSPPLPECTIPAGVWRTGYMLDVTNSPGAYVIPQMCVFVVDAEGNKVATIRDSDQFLDRPTGLSVSYTSNRRIDFGGGRADVPQGGRFVVEFWFQWEDDGHYGQTGSNFGIGFNGWDDNIPRRGAGGWYGIEILAGQPGSYIEAPAFLAPDVFDAMRDGDTPLRVTRAWATSVVEARSSAEQRASLRETPADSLTAGFAAIDALTTPALDALLRRNSQSGYYLPWWPDVQTLAADLASGSSVLPVATLGYEFVVGEKVILYQKPGTWETGTVASVDADGVTLEGVTVAAWPAGTLVMPLKRAVLVADHDARREASFAARAPLTFRVLPKVAA